MMKCTVYLLFGLLVLFQSSEAMIICKAQSVSRGEPANITCSFNRDLSQFRGVYYVHRYDKNNQFKEILNCAWTQDSHKCDKDPNYNFDYVDASTLMLKISSASDDDVGSYVCQTTPADMDHSEPCTFKLRDSITTAPTSKPNVPGNDTTKKSGSSTYLTTTQSSIYGGTTAKANDSQIYPGTTPTDAQRNDNGGKPEEREPSLLTILIPVVLAIVLVATVVIVVILLRRRSYRRNSRKQHPEAELQMADVRDDEENATRQNCMSQEQSVPLLTKAVREAATESFVERTYQPKEPEHPHIQTQRDSTQNELNTKQSTPHPDTRSELSPGKSAGTEVEPTERKQVDHTPQRLDTQDPGEQGSPLETHELKHDSPKETTLHDTDEHARNTTAHMIMKGDMSLTHEGPGGVQLPLTVSRTPDQRNLRMEKDVDVKGPYTDGGTALHEACRVGNKDGIIALLDRGIDIEVKDNQGWTPLHKACKFGQLDSVTTLLDKGADVNARGENGVTPLHLTSQNGLASVLEKLLEKGASIEAADNKGLTSFHWACEHGKTAAMRSLLAHGANVNARGNDGTTAFLIAYNTGHVTEVLGIPLENGFDVNAYQTDGQRALHLACTNGNAAVVNTLVSRGSNVNLEATNVDGLTPLHCACKNGKGAIVKMLIEKRADLMAKDDDGWTPLHWACQNGSMEIVKMLCEQKVNILAKTQAGFTPKKIAKQCYHKDIVKYLKKKSKEKHTEA